MASCIINDFIWGYNIASLELTQSHCAVIFRKLDNWIHFDYPFYTAVKIDSKHHLTFILPWIKSHPPAPLNSMTSLVWFQKYKDTGGWGGEGHCQLAFGLAEQLQVNSREIGCAVFHHWLSNKLLVCLLELAIEYWRGCYFQLQPCS